MFWILQKYPNIECAIINDINKELICTYQEIKTNVAELIDFLSQLQQEYVSKDEEDRKSMYLSARQKFNSKQCTSLETAAFFIFLNKTCFNGLYRVNSKGLFNVPHGRYVNPKICDKENLLAVSKLLQKVKIMCGDFLQTEVFAGSDTIYYFDPPYRPISETSSFTSYTQYGFDDNEQIRLRDMCVRIAQKDALFITSNSDSKQIAKEVSFFDSIYHSFSIKRVFANRMVNSKANGRGLVPEIMISNVVNM